MFSSAIKPLSERFFRPFGKDLPFFVAAFLPTFLVVLTALNLHLWGQAVNTFFHNFFICYLFTLLIGVCSKRLVLVLKGLVVIWTTLCALTDYVCLYFFQYIFETEIIGVLRGTNWNEIIEFFVAYGGKFVVFVIGIPLIQLGVYFSLKRFLCRDYRCLSVLGFSGLCVSLGLLCRQPAYLENGMLGRIYTLCFTPGTPNLKDFQSVPKLEIKRKDRPNNIVLIVGESFAKSHSSLYGYNKPTNPRLESMVKSDSLLVFRNVKSEGLATIEAFQSMLSTYKLKDGDEVDWTKCQTLPNVLRHAGYKTTWISNQSAKGLFDNIVGEYAELCDTALFVGNKYIGTYRKNLDEELLDLLRPQLEVSGVLNFYLIHMMGSHAKYKYRYPIDFLGFTEDDYAHCPPHQRSNLMEYDNSVCYNDSVVYELMRLFDDREAIVFYTSDHGEDVYESSTDYIGHGKPNEPLSADIGRRVPFLVYTTRSYRERFPERVNRMRGALEQHFSLENMICIIMDEAGVRFSEEKP